MWLWRGGKNYTFSRVMCTFEVYYRCFSQENEIVYIFAALLHTLLACKIWHDINNAVILQSENEA